MISSLPGKTSRSLVESLGLHSNSTCILEALQSNSTCVLKALPGKLDIKRHEYDILFISLQVDSLFKLEIILCRFNVIDDVIQKVHRHDDLIKAHAMR